MTRRTSPVAYAALGLALLALFSPFAGVAHAAGHKIGKNLVVSKSIKNGAVTAAKLAPGSVDGSRVKDGSLAAADLAPGTIPLVPSGRAMATASANAPGGGSVATDIAPSGAFGSGQVALGLAPVDLVVSDLRVRQQAAEFSNPGRKVTLQVGTTSQSTAVLTCVLGGGSTQCASSGTGTIPAGSTYFIRIENPFGGSPPTGLVASYLVKGP